MENAGNQLEILPTMTSTIRDLAPPARRAPTLGALAVRITGGGLDGRVIQLLSPKCTVGSGPRCTLRLVGRGIRPLHCLIVRADRGMFVRRWSPDTRLNGRAFEDAALQTGDRLTIGPLDLEILPGHEARTEGDLFTSAVGGPASLAADADPLSTGGGALLSSGLTDNQRSEALRSRVAAQRKRARGLLEALRASRRREQESASKVSASLAAQQQFEERIGQLTSEAGEANERARSLQAQVDVVEQEKVCLIQQQETTQQELQELRESRERETPASEADGPSETEAHASSPDELQIKIAELSAELDAHRERERALITQLKLSKERQTALRQQIQEVTSEGAGRNAELEARLAELEREKQELADLRREFQQERNQLAAERAAWEAGRSQEPRSEDSLDDVRLTSRAAEEEAEAAIAHLRELSLWSDDAPQEEELEPSRTADPPTAGGAPVSFLEKYAPQLLQSDPADRESHSRREVASPPRTDDDESLSDYMAKLMLRVRGDDEALAMGSRRPEPVRERPSSRVGKVAAPPAVFAETAPPKPAESPHLDSDAEQPAPFRLQDIKRHATLPERSGNFAAMRELANQSAHSAITDYQVQRVVRDGLTTLLSGAICLGTGLAALYLAAELRSAATIGGAAGLLLAVYFFVRGTLNLLSILREGRYCGKRAGSAKPRSKPQPAPVAPAEEKEAGAGAPPEQQTVNDLSG